MISPRSLSKSVKEDKNNKSVAPWSRKKTPNKTKQKAELQYFFSALYNSRIYRDRRVTFCCSPHPFNLGRFKIYPLWLPLRLLCCDFSSAHFQVVVRIKFPDRLILQAFFRPMEKGITLEFVEDSAFHVLDLVPFLY